jgi:uncharacterized protein (TIGR04141 family)
MRAGSGFHEEPAEIGRLYVGQNGGGSPRWATFLRTAAGPAANIDLKSQSCGAAWFIDVTRPAKPTRILVITFGTGHLALDPECVERSFGLKVVLNTVARSQLRTLDVASLDATVIQRRTQSSRDIDINEFGMDRYRDLLRLAAGTPSDVGLARTLSGRDSLTLNRQYTVAEIKPLCARLLTLSEGVEYETDYKFIDNVKPVRDKSLVATLDGLAFAELGVLVRGQASDLHLSIPDILDPSRGLDVTYVGAKLKSGRKHIYAGVDVADYVEQLNLGKFAKLTLDDWRATHAIRFTEGGSADPDKQYKVRDCIVWETVHDKVTYVLFGGEWFAIDDDFYIEIEKDFRRLVPSDVIVTSTKAANEQELLAELDKLPQLLLMDKTKTNPTGAPGANIEFCDFFSLDRQLIHLKDGHASASISHLWNQGVVGSESFLRDEGFRRAALNHVRKRQKETSKAGFDVLLPTPAKRPSTSDFTIIYGIMRAPYKKTKKLDLPFFSKVSLRAAAQRLEDLGFGVEVQLIEMV